MHRSSSATADPTAARRWHSARRLLLIGAILAASVFTFYAVENWRGKRAWEQCRRELESAGEVLDWSAYIPPSVPDEQNMFKAFMMREWFVKDSGFTLRAGAGVASTTTNPIVATVQVMTPSEATNANATNAIIELGSSGARERVAELLRQALGEWALSARSHLLVGRPLNEMTSVGLTLVADPRPSPGQIMPLLPSEFSNHLYFEARYSVRYGQDGRRAEVARGFPTNSMETSASRFSLRAAFSARDYLRQTQPLADDFQLIHAAMKRPHARIEGDYQDPFELPLPNFVAIRTFAQTASERAQCYLLLGDSEAAYRELSILKGLCRLLESSPPGRPLTLVAAMIEVAVAALYGTVIQDGLRLEAWREPQLAALQRELESPDLLRNFVECIRAERAQALGRFESARKSDLAAFFFPPPTGNPRAGFKELVSQWMLLALPRGWIHHNLVFVSFTEQTIINCVNVKSRRVHTSNAEALNQRITEIRRLPKAHTFLGTLAVPNFVRALGALTRTQTRLDQARVACALERYRLARGRYPNTLDDLAPEFLDRVPQDLIDGQPLRYRATSSGGHTIHSVGWDGKDDGGRPENATGGDWVWSSGREE